jgi:hypothetical protein
MPSKIFQNWDFWFENKPSGNPGIGNEKRRMIFSPGNDRGKNLPGMAWGWGIWGWGVIEQLIPGSILQSAIL